MNSVIVLCVGMMGAANPNGLEAQHQQPVQVAAADYSILPGGCYSQPAYRAPVAQNFSAKYPAGSSNCAGGWCGPIGTASYPSGSTYAPANYQPRTANCVGCANGQCSPQCHAADCPNGQCLQHGLSGSQGTNFNRSNTWRQGSRYHQAPATRYPAGGYAQPRGNSYPAPRTYDVNWTNTNRPIQPSSYQNSTNPYFN